MQHSAPNPNYNQAPQLLMPVHMSGPGFVTLPAKSQQQLPMSYAQPGQFIQAYPVQQRPVGMNMQYGQVKPVGQPIDENLAMQDPITGEQLVGVGIFFQQEADDWIYVASLLPGSSAELSGRIRVDDELVRVDEMEISPRHTLDEVRRKILGPRGSFVTLHFRRPGGFYGTGARTEFHRFDVELMRGSADFIAAVGGQQGSAPPPQLAAQNAAATAQLESELARLRDENRALRRAQEDVEAQRQAEAEDPRVIPLEEELKARMEDLRRFEQMLLRSQERAREADAARQEAVGFLAQVQEECETLKAREAERLAGLEDAEGRTQEELRVLQESRVQSEEALEHERAMRAGAEERLRDAMQELDELRSKVGVLEAEKARLTQHNGLRQQQDELLRGRMAEGHAAIFDALKVQEAQMAQLADIIPSLDMVHSSLLSSLAVDPIRFQTDASFSGGGPSALYNSGFGRAASGRGPLDHSVNSASGPALSASMHGLSLSGSMHSASAAYARRTASHGGYSAMEYA